MGAATMSVSPYIAFRRDEWRLLRAGTPLTLNESDLVELRGCNERVSLAEVEEIYLPLSRLLNLYVAATQDLYRATRMFLGNPAARTPFIIGIAGSVAVGKSTTARILRALLSRWPHHPRVDLVTTDGFLYPNRELAERDLLRRKGFPESYNVRALLAFVADLKAGEPVVESPVYSHLAYDIVPGELQRVEQPDIVIVEGLNVLQFARAMDGQSANNFVSDYFDFSIFVDAETAHIESWYVERFLTLRSTAFADPQSYFHRYSTLSDREATQLATEIWRGINEVNLRENILPTRERAQLILEKGQNHRVERVRLRKI
ncbi:MAG: type I pantothenate kinase [Planctomycetota bacterium]